MQLLPKYLVLPIIIAFISGLFFTSIHSVYFAPTILFISLFSLIIFWNKGFKIPKSAVTYIILLWWLYIILSYFWSYISFSSILFLGIFSIIPLLFISILNNAEEDIKSLIKYLSIYLLVAILLLAIGATVQFFFFFTEYGPRIEYPMANPNSLAVIFAMTIIAITGRYLLEYKNTNSKYYLFILFILFMALFVTYSRGAIFSTILSQILLFVFYVKKERRFKAIFKVALLGAITYMLISYSYMQLIQNDAYLYSMDSIKNISSLEKRVQIWKSSLELIKENPIFGIGLGNFYAFYPKYRFFADTSSGNWAHSDSLQILIELGIIGLILFYFLLTAILIRTIIAVQKSEKKLKIIIPFAAMLVVFIHGQISFHIYQPAILIPLSLLLTWWYFETNKILKTGVIVIPFNFNMWRVVILLIFLVVTSWNIRAAISIYLTEQIKKYLRAEQLEKFAKTIEFANKIAPKSYIMPKLYVSGFHLGLLQNAASNMSNDNYASSLKIADNMLSEAEKQNPKEPTIKYSKANLFLIKGSTEKAKEILIQNLEDNPRHIKTRMLLSDIFWREGKKEKALTILENGLYWAYAENVRAYYLKVLDSYYILGYIDNYNKLKNKIDDFYKFYQEFPKANIRPIISKDKNFHCIDIASCDKKARLNID